MSSQQRWPGRPKDQPSSEEFTALLRQAIQTYADAVAAHALYVEGITHTGENPHAVAAAQAQIRRLLAQIPACPAPDDGMATSALLPRHEPATDLAALFAGTPDGILVAGPDGRYLDANPAACRLLGYERHELLGRYSQDMVVPGEEWFAGARKGFLSVPQACGQVEFVHRDGSLVPLECRSVVISSPDGPRHALLLRKIQTC